jgi:hypothetical protein
MPHNALPVEALRDLLVVSFLFRLPIAGLGIASFRKPPALL